MISSEKNRALEAGELATDKLHITMVDDGEGGMVDINESKDLYVVMIGLGELVYV